MHPIRTVLVTGGAGYVGAVLVPKLLDQGYQVKVIDLFLYGRQVLADRDGLVCIQGDIRNQALLRRHMAGVDAVIHLACISNDPSYELDPVLGKSINHDAFAPLVAIARQAGVRRFLYASSSSVYGIKNETEVTEDLTLEPLTDYSKYKALCEAQLAAAAGPDFIVTTLRPSTVCGYSPRLRLDLTVNIFTNQAVNKGRLTVFGGRQMRPNLHIQDMAEAYLFFLEQPEAAVQRKVYNIGYENYAVAEIAEMVRRVIDPDLPIETTPSNDTRSYHVSSKKVYQELGFRARHTVEEAIVDLKQAFAAGQVPDPLEDIRYYNIKTMQHVQLA